MASSKPNCLPKAPPPNTTVLEVRLQQTTSVGRTQFSSQHALGLVRESFLKPRGRISAKSANRCVCEKTGPAECVPRAKNYLRYFPRIILK